MLSQVKRLFLFILFGAVWTSGLKSQVVINEVMASNASAYIDPDEGDFSDWIELYNIGENPVDLTGFYLSDNSGIPDKWQFPENVTVPRGGYLLVMADHINRGLHTNFAISRDGESLLLVDNEGNLIDRVDIPAQLPDISYGRDPESLQTWKFFGEPSPGRENPVNGINRPNFAQPVAFSLPAGRYPGKREIKMTVTEPGTGGVIRYTTNGSIPRPDSPVYTAPVTLAKTTPLRARYYSEGKLPGPVTTRTYIIGDYSTLPVFSISIDSSYLWNPDWGIYVDGSGFDGTRTSRNSCHPDWERPINIEFFEITGNREFTSQAGMQIKGRMNCEFPKKPLGIFFRSKYGNSNLHYRFFQDKTVTRFSSFMLRPGGADGMGNCYNGTMFRDGLLGNLLIGYMDVDYEAYRPAILYLNGQYWGIHNIRERNKSDYLAGNWGVDPDQVDLLENASNGGVIKGDDLHYQSLLNLVRYSDVNDPAVFDQICSMMDMDEFIDYQIAELFINNQDWANNNVLCWRPRTATGKWRWVFFDVEGGFGLYGSADYAHNMLNYTEDNFLHHRALFYSLMKSNRFKAEFLQRFATHLNTTFATDRVLAMIDRVKAVIEPEMERDVNRWKGTATVGGSGCSPIASLEQWEDHVEIMREFARRRPAIMRDQLTKKYNLPGTFQLDITVQGGGTVRVNGAEAGTGGIYFSELPLRLTAQPAPGFRFAGWIGTNGGRETTDTFQSDTLIEAVFEHSDESVLPALIDTLMILRADQSPYVAAGDVIVTASGVLRMEAGTEIRMAEKASLYVSGAIQADGTAQQKVLIRNRPGEDGRWGALVINQAAGYCYLSNLEISQASYSLDDPLKYKANLNIIDSYVPINGLVITDCEANPVYCTGSRVWIRDASLHSSGVCDLINVARAGGVQIEGSHFTGSRAADTDGIDLDSVTGAVIRNNYFGDFSGINNDGIDMGFSSQILISGNRFEYISDKAVSVGLGSQVTMQHNLIIYCGNGAGIKDEGSFVLSDRNTFFGNTTGIHCFEKVPGRGGGMAKVVNSLFAGSSQDAVTTDAYSSRSVSYSLNQRSLLPGDHNLTGDPHLKSPETGDFMLEPGSPCINSGDPDSPEDPDGTRADIGYFFRHKDLYSGLFVNEISTAGQGTWFEIYNNGPSEILPGDLYVSNGRTPDSPIRLNLLIPDDQTLSPGAFIAIPDTGNLIGLSPSGGTLILSQYLSGRFHRLNRIVYPLMSRGNSYGCYPDGSYQYRHFSIPTPGDANQIGDEAVPEIFINEFLAENQSGLINKNGLYEDWIELFNASDNPYDVGGLFLTDNLDNPLKAMIPRGIPELTTIPPQGFLLLWADDQPLSGSLHLGFKLDGNGEEIGLVQLLEPDTILIDSVLFGIQQPDISFGRIPDGGSNWQPLADPTPGSSNILLSDHPVTDGYSLSIYPNPATTELFIRISGLTGEIIRVELIAATGRKCYESLIQPGNLQLLRIPVQSCSKGVYTVRVITPSQNYNRLVVIR
ncbi:MAG: CotH kinase family protein [Bacteroidales bacterium]|nr:CotH kinase family protein [Bacteroidales bacterium]